MRYFLALVLICAALALTTTPIEASVPPVTCQQADTNRDGMVNSFDLLVEYYFFQKPASTWFSYHPDVDGDGAVTTLDLAAVGYWYNATYFTGHACA